MSETPLALILGDQIKPFALTAAHGVFVFTPRQNEFMRRLMILKNFSATCIAVGWSEDCGNAFLNSRKFKKFINFKLQAQTNKQVMTEDNWWGRLRELVYGYSEKATAKCLTCGWFDEIMMYEVEQSKDDNLESKYPCPNCGQITVVDVKKEPMQTNRENMVAFQEWGSRVLPKIERVHHQFENSEIVFESSEGEK